MNSIVVVAVNEQVDFGGQFAQGFKPVGIPQVNFEFVIKRFLIAILPWAAFVTHRNRNSGLFGQAAVKHGSVFLSLVGVQVLGWLVFFQGVD